MRSQPSISTDNRVVVCNRHNNDDDDDHAEAKLPGFWYSNKFSHHFHFENIHRHTNVTAKDSFKTHVKDTAPDPSISFSTME